MRKTLPFYLDLELAEAQLQAATKRKKELADRALRRLNHIIDLCKPLTGVPEFKYAVDLDRTKFKKNNTRISIMKWIVVGQKWEHARYIDIPTVWLEESTTDEEITDHLKTWLEERWLRRRVRDAEIRKAEARQRIDDLIKRAGETHPELAEEIKNWQLIPKN